MATDVHGITISVTLYPEEMAAIKRWAKEDDRSKSGMVRRLISQEIERRSEAEREAA